VPSVHIARSAPTGDWTASESL